MTNQTDSAYFPIPSEIESVSASIYRDRVSHVYYCVARYESPACRSDEYEREKSKSFKALCRGMTELLGCKPFRHNEHWDNHANQIISKARKLAAEHFS